MSICPKNKSSKARRDKRRANWKMSAPNLVKCSKCGELIMKYSFFILFKRRMVLTFLLGFWQIVDRKEQLRYI